MRINRVLSVLLLSLMVALISAATVGASQIGSVNLWELEYPIDKKLAADILSNMSTVGVTRAYAKGADLWYKEIDKQVPIIERVFNLDNDCCRNAKRASDMWQSYSNKLMAFISAAISLDNAPPVREKNYESEKYFVYKYRFVWQLHMAQGRYPFDSFTEVNSSREEENYYSTLVNRLHKRLSANKPGYRVAMKAFTECDAAWHKYLDAEVALMKCLIKEDAARNLDLAVAAIYKIHSASISYYLDTYIGKY